MRYLNGPIQADIEARSVSSEIHLYRILYSNGICTINEFVNAICS